MRPWLLVGLLLLPACAPAAPKHLVAIITTHEAQPAEPPAPPEPTMEPSWSAQLMTPRPIAPNEIQPALRFLEALAELEKLRKMHPDRHEVIFNEALLVDGYGFTTGVYSSELMLQTTIRLYREFIEKAATDPDAGDAVYIAKNRLREIESIVYCGFTRESEGDRKQKEAEEKQRAAQAEIDQGDAENVANAAPKK